MTFNTTNFRRTALLGLAAITLPLTACAGVGANYQPIVDGPIGANYSADLDACRNVAQQRNYVNNDTKNDALLGAVLGGLLGLTESGDDAENLLAGALVGGALGGPVLLMTHVMSAKISCETAWQAADIMLSASTRYSGPA